MDGMLSQDEINALLSGLAAGEPLPEPESVAPTPEPKPMVHAQAITGDVDLSDVERDAIGEVANISMGTSATTLYSLVNNKVNITTPVVDVITWGDLVTVEDKPCVFIQINYTAGLDGNNILILREHDVKIITDLMMGGDGTNTEGELGELHLSAISEAMNQMMGSAATSLSQMLDKMIDISPPSAHLMSVEEALTNDGMGEFLKGKFVRIAFRMQIGELVDSTILQLYPIDFAKELVATFLGGAAEEPVEEPVVTAYEPPKVEAPQSAPIADTPPMPTENMNPMMGITDMGMQGMNPMMGMPMQGMNPMMGMPMQGMPMQGMNPMMGMPMQSSVSYQPAQFETFSNNVGTVPSNENISLIMDVPLEVTVELGRTSKSISEILDFTPGTIIELDKIAGEPIDVLVNGKFVAKGEVVVIEESFGIRVTEIIK